MLISYPSEQFPSLPEISVVIPQSWEFVRVEGSLMGAVSKMKEGFHPNVVVGHSRLVSTHTQEEIAEQIKSYARTLPQVKIGKDLRLLSQDKEWVIVSFSYVHESVGPIGQVIAAALFENHGVYDLFRITGSATPEQTEAQEQIQAIIQSVNVTVS
ncbi:MAG: hypothetical protein LBM23_10800 [Propionibacteriaceae bacterium]|jgi:hypothetical protein|nr:hypothetical protein [Propionibacteriaceae bacterium]